MRIGIEKDQELITQKFRRMPVNNDLNNAILNTKEYVKTLNEHNSQKRDCHKDKNEMQKQIDSLFEDIRRHDNIYEKSKVKFKNIDDLLEIKLDRDEMNSMKELIVKLPT